MRYFTLSLLFVFGIFHAQANGNSELATESIDCMREILEQSFVNYAAIYFADSPRGTDAPIVPSSLDPPTAKNLFSAYYGEDASPSGFKSAIARILYADLTEKSSKDAPTQSAILEADRVFLRSNIYRYAKAGSYDIAREKFGVLLYNGYDEIVRESDEGDCYQGSLQKQMRNVIHAELSRIRNDIGEFQFGQFLGLGSGTTLAFAIDDTGSMGGEIEAAKERAINIIDQRQGSLDQPQNFVLVPFNDPGVGPLTVTHDPKIFKNAINQLYAHGGGDAPELSMRGIQLAVENSNAGSTIFVITDIDAKDVELQDNVVAQAKQKNIRVTFLLTNRMGTTVCGRGDANPRRCGNSALKLGYDLYEYIAESTGGRILVVQKDAIFKATEVIESTLKQGLEDIFIKRFEVGKVEEYFYVDSSLKELFVQSEGACGNITVRRSNGTVSPLKGDLEVDRLKVWKTSVNESFGRYSLQLEPSGQCDITISAKSTKGFVKTLTKRMTDSTTGEVWLKRFEGQPLKTDSVVLLIDEFGKIAGETTELISIMEKASNVSHDFPISGKSGSYHSIALDEYPQKSLLVKVVGVDAMGYKFQRVSSTPIEFVSVDIDCSALSEIIFRPGDTAAVNITVRNIGPTDIFSLEVNDDKGYVVAQEAFKLELREASTGEYPITFTAKRNERTGTVSTVTITASARGGANLIFKQCRLIIGQKEKPDIESFHVVSNINSRFVETSVTSTVFNNASVSRMAEFNVIMPLNSFITQFSMTIDNITYPGEIKEKETAKRIFEAARARGVTAGHVAARGKSTTVFKTSVNLEANKRVVFELKYQQLLRRSRGKYRHEVIIQTQQPVGKMSVDVYICETRPLANVHVLGFDTEQSVMSGLISIPGVTVDQQRTTAHIAFNPTREEQLRLSPLGLNGKFIAEYDVVRESGKDVNEILANDRHFVHFFSSELDPLSKRVVFLLDNSASMHGRKMEQVRSAMEVILDGLSGDDFFAIIMFNNNVTKWNSEVWSNMALANSANVASAKEFLRDVKSEGSTNIGLAVTSAIEVLRNFSAEFEKNLHPTSDFILLLTDGRPTEGFVQDTELINSIDQTNNRTYGIHTIGFGSLVDMKTLAKIAARNNGSSIQIFEDINADLQISDFFETFARPMLHDIEITYSPEQVERTTVPNFPVLFDGSEIVVAGKFSDNFVQTKSRRRKRQAIAIQLLDVTIRGKKDGENKYELDTGVEVASPSSECLDESTQVENFTERLNVFMELQHMLKRISAENNKTVENQLKEEALNQSLEFGFVTPGITSMLVLKPEDLKAIEKELEEKTANETVAETEKPEIDTTRPPPRTRLPLLGEDDFEGTDGGLSFSIRPTTISRSIGSSRRIIGGRAIRPPARPALEFFGDPHFFVQIGEQITLCFNWDGHDGQIFNILHDQANGLTVNGKLTMLRTGTTKHKRRTYVDKIGMKLSHENVTIEVSCYDIVVTDGAGNITRLFYESTRSVDAAGIHILLYGRTTMYTAEALFEIKPGISFRVIRRMSSHKERVALDHLDFIVINKDGISENSFGVLGQFSHEDTTGKAEPQLDVAPGNDRAVIWYRKRAVHARMRKMRDYNWENMVDCWFVPKPDELLNKGRFRYFLDGLFEEPNLKKAPPLTKRIFS